MGEAGGQSSWERGIQARKMKDASVLLSRSSSDLSHLGQKAGVRH